MWVLNSVGGARGCARLTLFIDAQIEYKLKLPTPSSPHRLAKLITQLRWRLVEGGGQALYELGVLDSGTLVGLTRTEMEETLQTLGRMLAGLGGGEVKVSRVVRVGGGAGGKSISSENSSSSSDDDRTSSSPNTPSLFNTFTVDAVDPTCYVSMPNTATMTVPFRPTHPQPPSVNVAVHTTGPIPISRAPHPERPAEERAQLKRAKRDARRAKKQEENDWMPPVRHRSPPALHFSLKHPANDEEMTKSSRPHAPHAYPHTRRKHQPPEKVKKATKPTVVSPHKPRPAAAGEEARYVVEAVVTKRSRLAARDGNARRSSGESSSNDDRFAFAANSTSEEDEEGTSSTVEDEEDGDGDGVEGWSFLDFDSLPKLRRGSAGVDVDVDALAGLSLSL